MNDDNSYSNIKTFINFDFWLDFELYLHSATPQTIKIMFNDTDIDNPMAKIVEFDISFFVNKCSALSAEKSVTSSQQIVNLKLFGAFTFPKPELLEKKKTNLR